MELFCAEGVSWKALNKDKSLKMWSTKLNSADLLAWTCATGQTREKVEATSTAYIFMNTFFIAYCMCYSVCRDGENTLSVSAAATCFQREKTEDGKASNLWNASAKVSQR